MANLRLIIESFVLRIKMSPLKGVICNLQKKFSDISTNIGLLRNVLIF